MLEPREMAARAESGAALPAGTGERFSGWGVMGLPFDTGHVLAMRRFPASSVGPGYTTVWHRSPDGAWRFLSDVEPGLACSRYFGRGAREARKETIEITWTGPRALRVTAPAAELRWKMELAATGATRALNLAARLLPARLWREPWVLSLMSAAAERLLGAGKVGLHGRTPSGQRFIANPRVIWTISHSTAELAGEDLGAPHPLPEQARLGDFWIPQRGLLAFGEAAFESLDPAAAAPRSTAPALRSASAQLE